MNNRKDNSRKLEITLSVLKAIGSVGAIAAMVVMPGLAHGLAPFIRGKRYEEKERIARNRLSYTIYRLKDRGFLKDAQGKLSLTDKGRKLYLRYQLKELAIKRSKKWDGKWRLIAFDVWEARKSTRDALRKTIQRLGFVQLQKSLWIFPYDCEELVGLLRTDLQLFKAIQYMVVDRIDDDQRIRQHFHLPVKIYIA
jgi:DNA-binding transcriptional regulator PaaX